jgi:hypothetical protein
MISTVAKNESPPRFIISGTSTATTSVVLFLIAPSYHILGRNVRHPVVVALLAAWLIPRVLHSITEVHIEVRVFLIEVGSVRHNDTIESLCIAKPLRKTIAPHVTSTITQGSQVLYVLVCLDASAVSLFNTLEDIVP